MRMLSCSVAPLRSEPRRPLIGCRVLVAWLGRKWAWVLFFHFTNALSDLYEPSLGNSQWKFPTTKRFDFI